MLAPLLISRYVHVSDHASEHVSPVRAGQCSIAGMDGVVCTPYSVLTQKTGRCGLAFFAEVAFVAHLRRTRQALPSGDQSSALWVDLLPLEGC